MPHQRADIHSHGRDRDSKFLPPESEETIPGRIEFDPKDDSMKCVAGDTRRFRQPQADPLHRIFCVMAFAAVWSFGSPVWAQREFPAELASPAPSKAPPASSSSLDWTVPSSPARTVDGSQISRSLDGIDPGDGVEQVDFSVERLLQDPLVDVVIEGNKTILTDAILQRVESRPGRRVTPSTIESDVSQLMKTRWFYSVRPNYRYTDEGPILVFQVVEAPILKSVTFKGNKKIKTEELRAQTGLTPNHAYDVSANRESVYRIKQLYHEKGYRFAEVTLEKGNDPDDREVVFNIVEGPKTKIWYINFEGNEFVSDAILRTKISSKTVKLWLIQGDYDPDIIQNDVLVLKQYYMSLGFFDVDVQSEELLSEDRSKVTVVFKINEGPRYKVDEIDVIGNEVIGAELLLKDLKLTSGDYFNERFLKEDVSRMTNLYDEQGRLFAKVVPTPRFREGEEALVDLVYEIDEDIPRYIGNINIHIRGDYPHTKEEVVRQQVNRFLRPGELARSKDLQMAKARVAGSPFWDKEKPPVFDIKPVDGTKYWPNQSIRGQDSLRGKLRETSEVRMSDSPDDIFGHSTSPLDWEPFSLPGSVQIPDLQLDEPEEEKPGQRLSRNQLKPLPEIKRQQANRPSDSTVTQTLPVVPASDRKAAVSVDPPEMLEPDLVFRGQSLGDGFDLRSQSLDAYGQPVPQNYLQGDSPQGDPFGDALTTPPPGFVDVNIDVTEGRTGRLMFGVGVNSDAGVVGSLVLQEDNFDILRPPTSFADILNGQAWRGAGQSLRIEAVPGSEVSRYMATWTDPYFLRTDFSLGVNGFYYNRYFESWTEERLGGRISLGYILNRYWSVGTSLRLENVKIYDIPATAPTELTSVRGDNFLSVVGTTLQYDARDNSFFPTRGHYANFSFDQAFNEFNYSRFELTGGKYFTIYERPDGFGKHILSFTGQVGFTGNDTPIFEKFYAGGYSSFRGFYYRGVSPVQSGVRVGGDFLFLGSAEYMLPITANDNIRAVFFSDFGTVEENVTFDNFRVTAGFGFRLTMPALGPAPLAFDFAWPLMKDDLDRERVFSFYVGFTR